MGTVPIFFADATRVEPYHDSMFSHIPRLIRPRVPCLAALALVAGPARARRGAALAGAAAGLAAVLAVGGIAMLAAGGTATVIGMTDTEEQNTSDAHVEDLWRKIDRRRVGAERMRQHRRRAVGARETLPWDPKKDSQRVSKALKDA